MFCTFLLLLLLLLLSGCSIGEELTEWAAGKANDACAKSLLLFFRLPPGYPRKKAARFFMPDGFLRNVIALILFFCGCRLRKALILQCSY